MYALGILIDGKGGDQSKQASERRFAAHITVSGDDSPSSRILSQSMVHVDYVVAGSRRHVCLAALTSHRKCGEKLKST